MHRFKSLNNIVIATLPQPMIVGMLKGRGISFGNLYQGLAAILVGLGIFFAVYGRQFFGLVQHRPLQR
jgi:hypothetical protein